MQIQTKIGNILAKQNVHGVAYQDTLKRRNLQEILMGTSCLRSIIKNNLKVEKGVGFLYKIEVEFIIV